MSLPERSVQLRGEVGDFGYQFDLLMTHSANLMLPPKEDPYLCSYPSSLVGVPIRQPSSSHIALFVSRGECSFEDKAKVALALQQNVTQDIKYVIVYNNDVNNPSQLIRMGADGFDVQSLGFLSVSTRAGSYAMSSILYNADATEQSPYLLANATDWDYPIDIEELRSYSSSGSSGANTFYFLRFVLFTLLILAPCLRAVYLWWKAGGRIEFRRNERGRIVGLRYIRPAPYWFAPSTQGGPSRPEPRTQLLTEEQVRALPELTYACIPDVDSTEDDTSVESGAAPEEPKESSNIVTSVVEPTNTVDNEDEETGQALGDGSFAMMNPEGLKTSCTTCSICIDDFEDGERIRLLPKCRHAFHTDCLLPWLTERQGCCPLCKRSVLDDDASTDEENHREEEGGDLARSAEEEFVAPVGANPVGQAEQAEEAIVVPAAEQSERENVVLAAEESQITQCRGTRTEVRSGECPV